MRSAERKKVNILEMKCLRSLVEVSQMDRVRNEEVRRRAGIEMELARAGYSTQPVVEYPARGIVGRVTDCCKSQGSILTSRTETSSLSRVVRDG